MKDQLHKIMEAEGMNPAKFADEIGVQRSSISHILSGRNKPSYDFISKVLARFSGINAEWLITGKGSMIKSSDKGNSGNIKQQELFGKNIEEKKPDKNASSKDYSINIDEKNSASAKKSEKTVQTGKTADIVEFTNVNNVKYILVFYTDGSFEQFLPRD